ncbi:MAG TPA: DsbE family thiol:disulfide interchange protein [Usitatibacter sp.]|nr:DsbE family thiol:disulfide interchange protein [Usitatibacter sp.]
MKLRYILPLAAFFLLAVFLAVGLTRDPREIPSPFIGKPAPAFRVAELHEPARMIAPEDMKGKVWMLNVWASWCVSCRVEHPVLLDFARKNAVPIVGLDYKDQREDGLQWLQKLGNPYVASAFDEDGKIGIDYGVYGVPETFVIDKQGIIRYKQIGPVTPEALEAKILPLLKSLGA